MRPANEEESRTRWSIAEDDRLGRVGRFLRRTSLDELPQLINVLRGDMTLVGPRPERPYFVEQFSKTSLPYCARHRVPAGLTGLAQVHGLRGNTSIEERANFDNLYIENWSLWADLKILIQTAGAVANRGGR
jgi:lipopolysaccharide/colanic/teichoic acid biosynthesis glycosyltransferase